MIRLLIGAFEWFGDLGTFFARVLRAAFTPPFEFREVLRQCDLIGALSLPLVALAGAATGVVLELVTRDSLVRYGVKSMIPNIIIFSMIKESGPIITSLMVAGRVGAGIGAQLSSMRVTEQIDAMEVSAVDPYHYLVLTRVVACVLMLPLLTVAADCCGILAGWLANSLTDHISLRLFIHRGFQVVDFADFFPSTLKTSIFGLIIGVVSSFQGMRATGGTEGVGRATTNSVVLASLFVILADVVLVRLILFYLAYMKPCEPIEIHELHKSFGRQNVLDGVNLTVHRGEILAVLGRSGAGKSVLLKILIGLQPANCGSVCIFGREIRNLPLHELNRLRRHMGFLFQQSALYDSLTVEENVGFPLRRLGGMPPAQQERRVRELLAAVDMEEHRNKLPSEISGGMQKRVGLARALVLDPEIVLYDEPTAGLDPITAAEIARLILDQRTRRQTTGVVVTHDIPGTRAFADRMVLLHNGRFVAEGTYAGLHNSRDPFVRDFLREAA